MSWYNFRPYVPVAQRRAQAARKLAQMQKKGQKVCPVRIEGRTIARTFWGKAWCEHLESYSDYANRLPRGRTYVRNGSVIDLKVEPAKVTAMVSGSSIYKVQIDIKPLGSPRWREIKRRCAGQIGSMIELLQGKLSQGVMQIITCRDAGMFPSPAEISLDCSCPDWAGMCKHVAAALYGVGARLDDQPELLFALRKVDHLDLIAQAGNVDAMTQAAASHKTIAAGELADVFGIELETIAAGAMPSSPARAPMAVTATSKAKRKGHTAVPAPNEAATSAEPLEQAEKVNGHRPKSKAKPAVKSR